MMTNPNISVDAGYTRTVLERLGQPGCLFRHRLKDLVLRESLSSPIGLLPNQNAPCVVGNALFDDFCDFLRRYATKETTADLSREASFEFYGQDFRRLNAEVPELTELVLSTLGFIGFSFFGNLSHFQEGDDESLRLIIPTFDSIFSGLATFSGESDLMGVITPSLSTAEETHDMMEKEKDERPLCLTTYRGEIHEFTAHPWLIFLHDVVHFLVWAGVPRRIRRQCSVLFRGLMESQGAFGRTDFFPTALDVASGGFYTAYGQDLAESFLDELRMGIGKSKDALLEPFLKRAESLSQHLRG